MIGLASAILVGCAREAEGSGAAMNPYDGRGDINEVRANIEAAKRNPSIADKSKAGPPIHLDPYVVSPPKGYHQNGAQQKAHGGKPH
jgi:hypothetical protein